MKQLFLTRLREARLNAHLKAREVAEKCGISPAYLSQMEHGGRKNPDDDLLIKLADVLGTSVDYLLGRTDDPGKPFPVQAHELESFATDVEAKSRGELDRLVDTLRGNLESWQAFDRATIEMLKAKYVDPRIEKYIAWCHANHANVRKAVQTRTRAKATKPKPDKEE